MVVASRWLCFVIVICRFLFVPCAALVVDIGCHLLVFRCWLELVSSCSVVCFHWRWVSDFASFG